MPQESRDRWRGEARLTHRTAILLGASGIAIVIVLGVAIGILGNGPSPIDVWWHDLSLAWRTDGGVLLARALHVIGGAISMILIGLLIVFTFLFLKRPGDALTIAAALLASEAITTLMKVLFARPRPEDSLVEIGATSFPSGHTTIAATIAVLLALILRRRFVWLAATLWVLAMAWSRTFLAAHWLTDVISGAILGASIALLVWALARLVRNRQGHQSDANR